MGDTYWGTKNTRSWDIVQSKWATSTSLQPPDIGGHPRILEGISTRLLPTTLEAASETIKASCFPFHIWNLLNLKVVNPIFLKHKSESSSSNLSRNASVLKWCYFYGTQRIFVVRTFWEKKEYVKVGEEEVVRTTTTEAVTDSINNIRGSITTLTSGFLAHFTTLVSWVRDRQYWKQ